MTWCLLATAAHAQLQSAREVRSLSFDEADSGIPVELVATVIFTDPPNTVFLQDETAGTFFQLEGRRPPKPGDEIRVKGISSTGLYLPGIQDATYEVLRHVGLPEPQSVSYDDLQSGKFHYQYVSLEGVVRSVSPDEESASVARLALGSRLLELRIAEAFPPPGNLIDSRVRVTGLAAGNFNDRRQLVEPYVRCQGWKNVVVLKPAPPVRRIPLVSPSELMNFDVEGQPGNRVRTEGIVLASFSGTEMYLRGEEASIGVDLLEAPEELLVGDTVTVAGFPEMTGFSARLTDAVIVDRLPGETRPEAIPAGVDELLRGVYDAGLVEVEADLADTYRTDRGEVLALRAGGRTIQARLPESIGHFAKGTRLRVVAICRVESARRSAQYRSAPESVFLKVRDLGDIQVLAAPPWWTTQRLVGAMSILLVAVVVGGLWIVMLRRQVSRQTADLRQRIEHEAALEERQRLAREFHDTLEQDLAGLSLRLDAARVREGDEKLKGLVEDSRNLVGRIQVETRNLVSDLRNNPDRATSLADMLNSLGTAHSGDVGPNVTVDVEIEESLPSRFVHHLGMIAREALTNAMKHAGAESVTISARREADRIVLTIKDDGKGFEPDNEKGGKTGHFGMMGMRERCRRIGAGIEWNSSPGEGTLVRVSAPLPAEKKYS